MNVLEALNGYDECRLKVGCADGNSYWYIGTVADFKKEINTYNDALTRYYQSLLDTAKKKLETALNRSVTPADYIKEEMANQTVNPVDWKVALEGYYTYLWNYFHEISIKRNTVIQRQQRLFRLVPLKKREVKKCFVADDTVEPIKCVVVVLEGSEPGAFWSTDEVVRLPRLAFRKEEE